MWIKVKTPVQITQFLFYPFFQMQLWKSWAIKKCVLAWTKDKVTSKACPECHIPHLQVKTFSGFQSRSYLNESISWSFSRCYLGNKTTKWYFLLKHDTLLLKLWPALVLHLFHRCHILSLSIMKDELAAFFPKTVICDREKHKNCQNILL
jgi:hypothetical protein